MATILEPCCKQKQFSQFLRTLKRGQSDNFIYYGDVTLPDWFTQIILETKGAKAYLRLNELDLPTFNYILNRMYDRAFIPGKDITLLSHVTIMAKTVPESLPGRAKVLQDEGRLILKKMKRQTKSELITLTPNKDNHQTSIVNPQLSRAIVRLSGNFFADEAKTPRHVNIKLV